RIVAILADRSRALAAAVAFGTFWQVLISLGWDYVDGAVIAYSSLAWACAMSASRSSSPSRYLVGAGAASAAMVHSNLGALFLVPGVLMSYVVRRGGDSVRSRRPVGRRIVAVLLAVRALDLERDRHQYLHSTDRCAVAERGSTDSSGSRRTGGSGAPRVASNDSGNRDVDTDSHDVGAVHHVRR